MKELKRTPALFQHETSPKLLEKYIEQKNTWIQFDNPKLKQGDVLKIVDETKTSSYYKFEVLYIGEARVNIKLIQK
jgi:hypothetical protein